jgi:hypothetical protein
MATRKIEEIWPGLQPMAKKAQLIAEKQGRPAYVVLNPTGDVCADFPGVDCHRVHANGDVDCCVCAP